jgi:SAM-dependent methyltransferase
MKLLYQAPTAVRLPVDTLTSPLADASRYAPWQPGEMFMRSERKRVAAQLLHEAGVFPHPGEPCLEIGYGTLGWLGDLISWGVREADLNGIELDAGRAERARAALPHAELLVGDARHLPWDSRVFRLVIASTVFTSILDPTTRQKVSEEIERVLAPGGALLWYDFAVPSPRNGRVKRINRRQLRSLFPTLVGRIRSITLAPPLARILAAHCWPLAAALESIPFLRTHLIAVLVKPRQESS